MRTNAPRRISESLHMARPDGPCHRHRHVHEHASPSLPGLTAGAGDTLRGRPMTTRNAERNSPGPTVRIAGPAETHCPYCALQCGMTVSTPEDGPQVTGRDFPTNRGGLCRKGFTSATLLNHRGRLTSPLVRNPGSGELEPCDWESAVARIASGMRAVQAFHGADAMGVFGGGGLTNEKAYLLGKFARVALRTRSIDYNGRFCMSSAATASNRAFGLDRGLPFPLEDIGQADLVLLVGANPAETMPPMMRVFSDLRRRGGRLIVVDPRRTATAQSAQLHLAPAPGSDLALANGILHLLVRERMIDREYIARRTTGFGAVLQTVAGYWPDRVERITGVPEESLRTAASWLGTAERVVVLTARGAEQHATGTETVHGFINIALALGQVGSPGGGYGCITGQGNGQGGREHGQKSDQLPGYRRIDDPEARAHVAGIWGVDPDTIPGPGPSAYELLSSMGTAGGVRGLLVMGSNVVVSAPRSSHVAERLAALDLLVVCDPFLSETAEMADVVLPTAQWAEEDGTMTNLEGRVIRRRAATPPPDGVRTDLDVIHLLADALGRGRHFFSRTPELAFNELRRASRGGIADYSGITYDRIDAEDGVFWPCPGRGHPGTPRLFTDRFPTADGRARFFATEHRGPREQPDAEFPLHLTTGRIMSHYQSGTQTRRVSELAESVPEPFVDLHPGLARRYGISDGDLVRIRSRRGEAFARARLDQAIRLDTVFFPFHWGGDRRANLLTNPVLDPHSRMPEFKACAVSISRQPEVEGAPT